MSKIKRMMISRKQQRQLANLIETTLNETNLTQSYVSKEIGLTDSCLSQYINLICMPTQQTLIRLCIYFDTMGRNFTESLKQIGIELPSRDEDTSLLLLKPSEPEKLPLVDDEVQPIMQLHHVETADPAVQGYISKEASYFLEQAFLVNCDNQQKIIFLNNGHQFIVEMTDDQFKLFVTKLLLDYDPEHKVDWTELTKQLEQKRDENPDNILLR